MTLSLETAVAVAAALPLALLCLLGAAAMVGNVLGERVIAALTRVALSAALIAAVVALLLSLGDAAATTIVYGTWFATEEARFTVELAADPTSLGFAVLALVLCNVAAAFSSRYLHREPGFERYFVQMAMFVAGITLVALAGSIDVLFVGWELLGLSSALLVGFFHDRGPPVRNALRVFAVYRLGDAAMLSAAVLLHHFAGSGSLAVFSPTTTVQPSLAAGESLALALLLIVAVAAKSALWPLSGWLPRAMEGPTPSSAVFYGALSTHAGCILLLRVQPLLETSPLAVVLLSLVGATTTVYASMMRRVQTDVKSAICYAALAQIGLITIEIALGLRALALLHIAGHACFRLLQFLSAPNVLHDLHELGDGGGGDPSRSAAQDTDRYRADIYLFFLERGFADALLDRLFIEPFRVVAGTLDRLDRWLVGDRRRGSR